MSNSIYGTIDIGGSIAGELKSGITISAAASSAELNLELIVHNNEKIYGTVCDTDTIVGQVAYPVIVERPDYPYYSGAYDVVPDRADIALPTKNTVVLDDITVRAVPSSRVHNNFGTTFVIGG